MFGICLPEGYVNERYRFATMTEAQAFCDRVNALWGSCWAPVLLVTQSGLMVG